MSKEILKINELAEIIKPIAKEYKIKEIYIFGSYARGEATPESDIDILVIGGEGFKLTRIFSFAEELRAVIDKKIDVFEIHEVNKDSGFYNTIMDERVLVA